MLVNQRSATLEPREKTDDEAAPPASAPREDARSEEPVLEDLLVEEVSIDGMCGVY